MRDITEQLFTAVKQSNLPEIKEIFEKNPITITPFFEIKQDHNLIDYAHALDAAEGDNLRQKIYQWLEEQFRKILPVTLDGIDYPLPRVIHGRRKLPNFCNRNKERISSMRFIFI